VGPVGQVGQGGGELDLDPVFTGVKPDGFVAPRLAGLPVRGNEQPGSLPALSPPGPGRARFSAVAPGSGQPSAAPAHRDPAVCDPAPGFGQPGLKHLEPALLLEALGPGGVAAGPATTGAGRKPKPPADPVHPR
jgi:hypothetical protein